MHFSFSTDKLMSMQIICILTKNYACEMKTGYFSYYTNSLLKIDFFIIAPFYTLIFFKYKILGEEKG